MINNSWGGRFKQSTHPQVTKFTASLSFDHVLYQHDISGSKAHAEMLARQHLVTQDEAQLMIKGLTEIESEMEQGLHGLDNACEDIHMFIEHLLLQKIGETAKKLHTGRSRNDQVALDLRLYSRESANTSKWALSNHWFVVYRLLPSNIKMSECLGYTHLQQAQPIHLGTFGAYLAMFKVLVA